MFASPAAATKAVDKAHRIAEPPVCRSRATRHDSDLWSNTHMRVLRSMVLISFSISASAQRADLAAVGGGGAGFGERRDRGGLAAAGVSVGFPVSAENHRVQLDYLLGRFTSRGESRHFITGSYVAQLSMGRTRPFLQIGAGVGTRTLRIESQMPSGSTFARTDVETVPMFLFGGGATIDLSRSVFIRPQLRLYAPIGPTLTLLPVVSVGWRF